MVILPRVMEHHTIRMLNDFFDGILDHIILLTKDFAFLAMQSLRQPGRLGWKERSLPRHQIFKLVKNCVDSHTTFFCAVFNHFLYTQEQSKQEDKCKLICPVYSCVSSCIHKIEKKAPLHS